MFKAFHHEASNQTYIDGAILNNNPVLIADKERKLLWPMIKTPDVFVSLGTSYNGARDSVLLESPAPRKGILSHGKDLMKIAIDHIALALDSEKAWHSFLTVLEPGPEDRRRYFRINPRLQAAPPPLDDVGSMMRIQETVRHLIDQDAVASLALRLIASSFYFEVSGTKIPESGECACKGKSPHCYRALSFASYFHFV